MRPNVAIGTVAAMVLAGASNAQVLSPGTVIVGDRTFGTILHQPLDIVASNGVISGSTLGVPQGATSVRGTGPTLSASAHLSLAAVPTPSGYRLFARRATNTNWGLIEIAPSGDRTLIPNSGTPTWVSGGDMLVEGQASLLSIADDFPLGPAGSGRLLRYNLATGAIAQLTGGMVGNGVDMHRPRAMTFLDESHVAIVEFGTGPLPGTIVYRVNLDTGNREVLSTISRAAPSRYTVTAGVRSAAVAPVPLRGSGPTFNAQSRGIVFVNNRLLVAGTVTVGTTQFLGGIIEIDPATGDRTLFVGSALDAAGTVVSVPFAPGSSPDGINAPTTLTPMGTSAIAFVDPFLAKKVWRLELGSKRLTTIVDLAPQMAPPQINTVALSGIAVTPCDGSVVSVEPLVQFAPVCPGGQITLTAQPTPAAATFAFTWELQNPDLSWSRIDEGSIEGLAFASTSTTRTLTLDSVEALAAGRAIRVRIDGFCGSATSAPVVLAITPQTECPNCSACAADYDANGGVDGGDLGAFFADFESGAPCADVDQNGGVDGGDLAAFFTAFEAGGC